MVLDRQDTDMNITTDQSYYDNHPEFLKSLVDRIHCTDFSDVGDDAHQPITIVTCGMELTITHDLPPTHAPKLPWPWDESNEKINLLLELKRHFDGLEKYPGQQEAIKIINTFLCDKWPELRKEKGSVKAAEHFEFFLSPRPYPARFS